MEVIRTNRDDGRVICKECFSRDADFWLSLSFTDSFPLCMKCLSELAGTAQSAILSGAPESVYRVTKENE